MIFTVKKIEEDLDSGCEEKGGDIPVMAVLTLEDPDRQESRIKMEDALLSARNIQEGGKVCLDEGNGLEKASGGDWTRRCNSRTIDTAAFVDRMQAVKAGKKIEWKCVFCGGNVGLIARDDTKTVIGCDCCDMRIDLESRSDVF